MKNASDFRLGISTFVLALCVLMPAFADSTAIEPGAGDIRDSIHQIIENQKARAEQRTEQLRRQADARLALIDPWAQAQRDWFRARAASVRQAMERHADAVQAYVDNQRRWFDPLADARRQWMEQTMDRQIEFAEFEQARLQRLAEAQMDWVFNQQFAVPLVHPPVAYGYYPW